MVERSDGALPNLVVIGAMKCGTTALHGYLAGHPQVTVSQPKELNFFFGPHRTADAPEAPWAEGNWHRGLGWYAGHFDPAAPVRVEASPGYTSPAHPGVAALMAAHLPDVRLVYLVRDPVERALSQYRHHRREGSEPRPAAEALLDPASQYLARSRYFERLGPFLAHFDDRVIKVVALEELRGDPAGTIAAVLAFAGLDPDRYPWSTLAAAGPAAPAAEPGPLRDRLAAALVDDADRLRAWAARCFPGWSV